MRQMTNQKLSPLVRVKTAADNRPHIGQLATALYTAGMSFAYCYRRALPGLLILGLTACQDQEQAAARLNDLDQLRHTGELVMLTRNTPSTYVQDDSSASGFEYDLASAFAGQLGVELRVETAGTIDQLFQRLRTTGRPALLAAGLTSSPARTPLVEFSDSYLQVTPQVIYNTAAKRPQSPAALAGKRILVLRDSIHADLLRTLQTTHPQLEFSESDEVEIVDLLRMVDEGQIDITLVNSNELAMHQVYFPHIQLAFSLEPAIGLQWAVRQHLDQPDASLTEAVNAFLEQARADGLIDTLVERYYGHLDMMGYVGAKAFARHLQQRLPKYEALFRQYADEYGLDWRLLAAVGYQESHWDPEARSKTGVRGLMMLTQRTAEGLGVRNRLDPKQSIQGGAKYLAQMLERLPDSIQYPERYWFALAAYNVGLGHLEDARKLTAQAGLNPDSWIDVRSILPRLAQKQWYSQTRHGFARGGEPVHFVNNIRRYQDILSWSAPTGSEDAILGGLHTPAIKD